MVYKVCKGGVRSGNTLRGLHTVRTKRYASQACVIGRSNLSRKQVDKLLEESTDDVAVGETLRNVDVVLSLNKRERWRLPSTVTNMIRAGQFSQSKATVSVLERHKLKRRANCVGFACSKQNNIRGLGGQDKDQTSLDQNGIQQGQKRYFSFNLDQLGEDESRRQRKKRIAEEMKQLGKKSKIKHPDMKTVDVFTIEGRMERMTVPNTKPVYRMEVFYPCPQSCSLTFNPKYTDVVMTQGDDGEMEIRSNKKNEKKSQRKKRKRFTARDLAKIDMETKEFDDDVEQMWQDVYREISLPNGDDVIKANVQEKTSMPLDFEVNVENNTHKRSSSPTQYSQTDIIDWSLLIDHAELARASLNKINSRARQRRNSSRGCRISSSSLHEGTVSRSHITEVEIQNRVSTLQEKSNITNYNPGSDQRKQNPVISSVPVILPTSEITPEKLKASYGQLYSEADCQPRRFCINITEEVTALLSGSRNLASAMYTTYVVFIYKGVYDRGMDVYEAAVNCAACTDSQHITYSMPNGLTTINTVINVFVGNLLDLKEAGDASFINESLSCNIKVFAPFHEMMMEKMKVEVDTFFTSDELTRTSESGSLQEKTEEVKDTFSKKLLQFATDNDLFCEICYESVNPTQLESRPGTQLNICGHLFCEECWRSHLRMKLSEGAFQMTCPGYQCDTKLGPSTLLSLLHVTEVAQIFKRVCENEVETCPTAKWCPSPLCGRVLRIRTKSSKGAAALPEENLKSDIASAMCLDVLCACGESWCFNCLSPAHWPARCEQAQDYTDKLSVLKPENKASPKTALLSKPRSKQREPQRLDQLEGKLCPNCHRFIDKNGGCPHISCRCGHQFCWTCLAPYNNHTICVPNAKTVQAYSRRVNIRHVTKPSGNIEGNDVESPKSTEDKENRRQKTSMYHRAIEQREEAGFDRERNWYRYVDYLTTKICRATGKDLQFKKEVLHQCGLSDSEISDLSANVDTRQEELVRIPVIHHVQRYLKSCREARLALRHVAEYTFVLLQDCPNSVDKRRAFRIASDLIGYCSFSMSIFQAGGNQNPRTALKRLSDIQTWSSRAVDTLLATVHRLNH
ncbi:E3 ubiquitin-protein ligase arih1 [Plakobranchus ocellatus]|uniref:RBR-type E3 ubiquitin transferase n=1 Tax=Plakobranchus ocellatus TaxID=259542 RepID=A0AAV4CQL8_9GAST|nr:E3 ubiquitin-protein ligase arih1 [Plakobranchus ocellatus]